MWNWSLTDDILLARPYDENEERMKRRKKLSCEIRKLLDDADNAEEHDEGCARNKGDA